MRDSSGLDRCDSGGTEIKLESPQNLGVKPAVFAFGFDVCFRGKKGVKIDTTVLGLNNGMEWNGIPFIENGIAIY